MPEGTFEELDNLNLEEKENLSDYERKKKKYIHLIVWLT